MKTHWRRLFCIMAFVLVGLNAGLAQGTGVTAVHSLTITNPLPPGQRAAQFGFTMAMMDTERVVIGAAGAAYLYNTNGDLLATFLAPSFGGDGLSAAALGQDRVIVGAFFGAAYLFNVDGKLLRTIRSPSPEVVATADSVAAIGTDGILVGGDGVCLFTTNGTLITTFTNAVVDEWAEDKIAPLGPDRVAIGDHTVYLFNTNGTLLTTFPNFATAARPYLGAVTTLGNDKVLIGYMGDEVMRAGDAAVYLFDTNGVLITTFTNPTRIPCFGRAVTAVGADKVLISAASYPFGSTNAAAVYLFSTNGTLLTATIHPARTDPAVGDAFGWALAAAGDYWIVGVWRAVNAADEGWGASHIYHWSVDAPRLNIERLSGGNVRLSWPVTAADLLLEHSSEISSAPLASSWTPMELPYETNATHISVTLSSSGNKFFRLRSP